MNRKNIKKKFLILFSIFFLVIVNQTIFADNDWDLIIDKKGVKVYTRSVSNSQLDEFKGITIVNARMEVIGEVLRNIADHPKWIDRCRETRIVKTFEDGSVICHVITDIPWPASTRDVVVRQGLDVSLNPEKGTIIITISFHAIDYPDIPPTKDIVRIKELTGKYVLEYIDREHTRVIFQTKTDPVGMIPSFLANYGSRSVPYNTLVNLHKEVKKPKYANVATDPAHIDKENLFVAKEILKTLSKDYVKDDALIETMVNDELIKQILMSDELTVDAAAKIILRSELQKRTSDQKLINDIINDKMLVERMLKEKGLTEQEVMAIISETTQKNKDEIRQ